MSTILAVRSPSIAITDMPNGFTSVPSPIIIDQLTRPETGGLWLGPRKLLEHDESFRQLIPYIVLARGKDVVLYQRAASGSESRLHGKMSVGIGGHVELEDLERDPGEDSGILLDATLTNAALREVGEEVGSINIVHQQWVGIINDTSDAVGRVHLGIVGIWEIMDEAIKPAESHLERVDFIPAASLGGRAFLPRLEGWSQALVQYLASRTS